MTPFTPAEIERRRAAAATALRDAGLDALVVSLPEHLTYLTGVVLSDLERFAVGWLTADGALDVLAEPAVALEVDAQAVDAPATTVEVARDLDGLGERLRGAGAARIGVEGDWYALTHAARARLEALAPASTWVEATSLLARQRIVKSPEEIAVIRRAAGHADAAMAAAVDAAHAGVRELDVAAAAAACLAANGSEYSSFPGLVGSGPRSGLYHPLPTRRRLEAGDAVEIEVTGAEQRYNSNLVRTIVVGRASAKQRTLHAIVREAFERGVEAVRAGRPVGDVDDATRAVRRDYADHIPSRAGYGIELSYPPFLTGALSILSGSSDVLEPGMVFSLEPSIAGYEGETFIIGCNVLVTDAGPEILHRFERGLIVVD